MKSPLEKYKEFQLLFTTVIYRLERNENIINPEIIQVINNLLPDPISVIGEENIFTSAFKEVEPFILNENKTVIKLIYTDAIHFQNALEKIFHANNFENVEI